ncbi:MAG: FAD binding domain-containing protein [Actinomycetota bacterium]|nr:FAD binding domain-containing protein [Actinomycetota bacterium]
MLPTTWTRPADLGEAIELVGRGAVPVGGACALMSAAFEDPVSEELVDVLDLLPAGVDDDRIGAGTTLAALAADPLVAQRWPAVAAAAALTATPQVRALATVGGSVAARLPTADLAAPLAAHGAVVELVDAAGATTPVRIEQYLTEPPTWPHLVYAVRLTRTGRGSYRRFALREGPAPAIATVAAVVVDGELRMWAGAVGPTAAPVAFMPGAPPAASALRTDARASARYRARLVAALAAELVEELEGR